MINVMEKNVTVFIITKKLLLFHRPVPDDICTDNCDDIFKLTLEIFQIEFLKNN